MSDSDSTVSLDVYRVANRRSNGRPSGRPRVSVAYFTALFRAVRFDGTFKNLFENLYGLFRRNTFDGRAMTHKEFIRYCYYKFGWRVHLNRPYVVKV